MLISVLVFATLALVKAEASCGGNIQRNSGYITSPGYPNSYALGTQCIWNIIASPLQNTTLILSDLDLEACDNCECDYVQIDDLNATAQVVSSKRYCGSTLPPNVVTSIAGKLRILFRSDSSKSYKGFKIYFNISEVPTIITDPKASSKSQNVKWLLQKLKKRGSLELPRATLALFLAEPKFFDPENKTVTEIIRDRLTVAVLSQISRNQTIRSHDLALYVQALMVACQDPRDVHGHDLVSQLRATVRSSAAYTNPFSILALCTAGAPVTPQDVRRVSEAFDSQHRPFWTDIQAIATMAMECLSSKVTVDERVIKDMKDELKKRQFRNGTVENLVTTALVLQALGSKNDTVEFFDRPSALDVLLRAQEGDGSWGRSVRNSFYLLPAVSGKSYLDINDKHCPQKTETEEESLARLQEAGGDKFVVQYSVWIGEDVDLGRTWRLRVRLNRNASFYDVLEMVSKLDNRHNVTYQVVDRKPYVRSLLGKEDDPESGIFWFTYVRSSSSKAPPTLVEISPADVNVIPNQELILWYKSLDWSGNETLLEA